MLAPEYAYVPEYQYETTTAALNMLHEMEETFMQAGYVVLDSNVYIRELQGKRPNIPVVMSAVFRIKRLEV